MTNNNENIVSDFKELIQKYLTNESAEILMKKFNEDIFSNNNAEVFSSLEKSHVENQLTPSTSYRLMIDRILTQSEKLLTTENYYRMHLDLSQLMLFTGENAYALEIAEILSNNLNTGDEYPILRAETSLMISKIYWNQSLWEDSNYYISEAMQIFLSVSNKPGLAKCENMLGTLYGEMGRFEKAKIHFENALVFLRGEEDMHTSAMILTNLGIINTIQGDYEKAIWNYKNSTIKFEKLNDTRRLSRTYHNIGMLLTRMNNYDAALEEFNKCITHSLANNYLSNCAIAYIGKAFIYSKLKNSPLADAYTDKAMQIACKINDTLSIADIYKIKGMIQNDLDNFQLSEELFENSIRLNRDIENQLNEAESSEEMAKLLQKVDRKEDANKYNKAAENYYQNVSCAV